MRKILLILGGTAAKKFLNSLIETYPGINSYIVVHQDSSLTPQIIPENFVFHNFDPTSKSKLSAIFEPSISEVFIVVAKKNDAIFTYRTVREINQNIKICFFDEIDMETEDSNLIRVKSIDIVANRLIQKLPNIPVTAQNIGLGIGEIMEISVPFGSSYSYRFIGNIEQKRWKIVGLYRDSKLLLAEEHLSIRPNDTLLVIGDPNTLTGVYKTIKKELGLFPLPFGRNIYLYIDMKTEKGDTIHERVDEALYFQRKLKNKKLYIRIANPSDPAILGDIKRLDSEDISIHIDYQNRSFEKLIFNDTRQFGAGVILMGSKNFNTKENKLILFNTNLPVIKLSKEPLDKIKELVILLSGKKEISAISPIIFDLAVQLELTIFLYDFAQEATDKHETVEYFENLARIYSKTINIVQLRDQNPIFTAIKKESYAQVIPFTKTIIKPGFFWFLSTDVDRLHFKLDSKVQIFIPAGE